MKTTSVGIRDAKIHLSKYVKMVKEGVEVILTERGRPVCRIMPISPRDLPIEERLKQLEDRGILEKLTGDSHYSIPLPIPVPDNIAQKFLQEDRNSG